MSINSRSKLGRFVAKGNTWEIKGDKAYCWCGGELLFYTDVDVYESIKQYSFCKVANGYSATHIEGKQVLTHRLISNPSNDQLVDHINRDKKDNRLRNLRNTNKSVNAFNCGVRKGNVSGITGVYFRKDTKRWTAEIKHNYKKICLGCFATKEEAIKRRKQAELEYFGEVKE